MRNEHIKFAQDHPSNIKGDFTPEVKFDRVSDDIAVLWNRVNNLRAKEVSFTGVSPSSNASPGAASPSTPSTPASVNDLHFFGYHTDGSVLISDSGTDLALDTEDTEDSIYAHTAGAAAVEILETGDYEIEIDGGFESDVTDIVEIKIQKDTGSGYADAPGSFSYASNLSFFNFAGDSGTGTINTGSQTFNLVGTANEVDTVALDQTITIGLPDSVIITTALTIGVGAAGVDYALTFDAQNSDGILTYEEAELNFSFNKKISTIVNAGTIAPGNVAAHFGDRVNNQDIYISGNTINCDYDYAGDDGTLWFNYKGFESATANFRDTIIGDGKTVAVITIDGSAGSFKIGSTTAVTSILDQDDMSSDSAVALATQQSIKAYVDTLVTAQDLDFAGDSGTGAVDLDSQVFTLAGTTNEISTSASGQILTIGLPNDVTIGGYLDVTTGASFLGSVDITYNAADLFIDSTNTQSPSVGFNAAAGAVSDSVVGEVTGSWNWAGVIAKIKFVTGIDTGNKDDGYMVFQTSTGGVLADVLTLGQDKSGQFHSNLMIGSGEAGVDYTLTFNGETSDGILTWDEDNSIFSFDSAIDATVSLDIGSTIAVVGTLDDDTFATATNTTFATSESIKAYGDNSFGLRDIYNGTIKETFNALVTSDGVTITMSLEQSGGGDLTMQFNDDDTILDCTPACTIALTAGSDTAPQANYIYILQSGKVLVKSTSGWPATEHIKVGYFFVQSAASVQTDSGVFINQNWNDHLTSTDNQGHLTHITERVRHSGANYFSGIGPNGTDQAAATSYFNDAAGAAAYFKSASGVIYQMHKHTMPALDSLTDNIHAINWSGDAYHTFNDLFDMTADSTGTAMSNKYFNVFFFSIGNKTGEHDPLMCKLPSGSYVTEASAINDVDHYDDLTMPREFGLDSSTGVPICRMTLKWMGGLSTLTHVSTLDLRTESVSGGAGGGGSTTEFADNQFAVFDETDITKIFNLDVGTLLTTGNTRTLQVPDSDGVIALLSDLTAQDLDFTGDSGTGAVDLDSQTFNVIGTANEIETSGSGQTLTVGLPDNVLIGGTLGVGGVLTDGILHILNGSAGVVAANSLANTAVFEASSSDGISVIGPDGSNQNIFLGSPSSNAGAQLLYNHDAGLFRMATAVAGHELQFHSGGNVLGLTLDSSQNTTAHKNLTIGSGAAGVDYTLTFNGETSDGVLEWLEDEDRFHFQDDVYFSGVIRIASTNKIYLDGIGGDTYLSESSANVIQMVSGGVIGYSQSAAGAVTLPVGLTIGDGTAATDFTLTFNGETNDGVLTWMEDEDQFSFADHLLITSMTTSSTITMGGNLNMNDNNIVNANIIGDGTATITFASATSVITGIGGTDILTVEDGLFTQWKGITDSTRTSDGWVSMEPAFVETTNTTETTLDSFTMTDGYAYIVEAYVVGTGNAANGSSAYKLIYKFSKNGADYEDIEISSVSDEGPVAHNALMDRSGNDIRLRVVGITAETNHWVGHIKYLSIDQNNYAPE